MIANIFAVWPSQATSYWQQCDLSLHRWHLSKQHPGLGRDACLVGTHFDVPHITNITISMLLNCFRGSTFNLASIYCYFICQWLMSSAVIGKLSYQLFWASCHQLSYASCHWYSMLISSAVTGKLTYHKQAVISCHISCHGQAVISCQADLP